MTHSNGKAFFSSAKSRAAFILCGLPFSFALSPCIGVKSTHRYGHAHVIFHFLQCFRRCSEARQAAEMLAMNTSSYAGTASFSSLG